MANGTNAEGNDGQSHWHIVRGLPIPALLLLAGQTAAVVWYAAAFASEQKQQAVRLTQVEVQLGKIADAVQASVGPSAVNAARLGQIENALSQVQSRQEAVRDELSRFRHK